MEFFSLYELPAGQYHKKAGNDDKAVTTVLNGYLREFTTGRRVTLYGTTGPTRWFLQNRL